MSVVSGEGIGMGLVIKVLAQCGRNTLSPQIALRRELWKMPLEWVKFLLSSHGHPLKKRRMNTGPLEGR